ncbi:Holliday junction resolvase RuvX [candidate division WWE3 bacterium]|jgi:putative Holliday junction resolvase|uniref:Putative pre-16S rRNA nuclease n=1 Tax=candidate division WWE3 bacterium TaxID=2053526 RepID=A0A3A4ZCI5_UNCKA|nr:MAG: Holliday junction resolvase RuvX [candidate division WWE3 bacterium]
MPDKSRKDETLLGIDYGEANIGVALGRNGIATPVQIVSGKNSATAINELARISIENKVDKFILGLPLDHYGKETKQSLAVRAFAKLLKIRTKKPVEFQDENGTSIEALEQSIEMGIPMKKRNMKDHLSAALILRHYYSEKKVSS